SLGGCILLANELLTRQILTLVNSLNGAGAVERVTKMRLQAGLNRGRIVDNNWLPAELCIWKDNLVCLSLLKAKSLQVEISNTAPEWEQLVDSKGQHLLLWPEIKFRTENVNTRSVKSNWLIQNPNRLLPVLFLPRISNDKRKREWLLSDENEVFKLRDKKVKTVQVEHWRPINNLIQGEVVMEKCTGCGLNSPLEEESCISRSKSNNDWRVIPKSLIKRAEGNHQMSLNLNLASEREKSLSSIQLANEQEFSYLNRIESVEEQEPTTKKICYYMDGSLQSENKKDVNLATMGAAVVQVNTEEDLVLEEISVISLRQGTDLN
ncbi:3991_t:CDS:2, partial [Gigaspora rosea]